MSACAALLLRLYFVVVFLFPFFALIPLRYLRRLLPFQNVVLHSGSCTKTLARRSGNESLSTSVISHISFSERAWSEFFLLLLPFFFLSFFSFLRPCLRFTASFLLDGSSYARYFGLASEKRTMGRPFFVFSFPLFLLRACAVVV